MAARDFQELTRRRCERARELAERTPAARQALEFLARLTAFQAFVPAAAPIDALTELIDLVKTSAPAPLAEEAASLDEQSCRRAIDAYLDGSDVASPRAFFARVLLQPAWYGREGARTGGAICPVCEHRPQLGLLRPQGDGRALWLQCSLCFHEWNHPRGRCPGCESAESEIAYYRAEQIDHVQVMTCDACRRYLHLIDSALGSPAPDIDEAAVLPLDLWAVERGFSKIQPNLIGI